MRIWTKLAFGFALTAVAIVAAYGALQLANERRDLRAAAEMELVLVGATMQVALENAFRDGRIAEAQEVIDTVSRRDALVDAAVVDPDSTVVVGDARVAERMARMPDLLTDARAHGGALVMFDARGGMSDLVGAFPLRGGGQGLATTLVVIQSLEEMEADLATEVRTTVVSLVTLTAGLAAAGWLLALVYVRRPLLRLVETMKAVRAGDLSAKAPVDRQDEIGAAIEEFNALMDSLTEARRRLRLEMDAREGLESRLQRADKLVTVGQLAAGLAHEIGSPLQVVNGRARALAATTALPQESRRSAGLLARECDRITRIVEQLLTFARRAAPNVAEADMRGPVEGVLELLGPEARRHDVRLEFVAAKALPRTRIDVGQIQQVVMNLLTNAIRAAQGGGRVRVTLASSRFAAAEGVIQPSVLLAVEDTGGGIDADALPHIFEPFFSTRADDGGTGLGLAVVKAIVNLHSGRIAVATEVGAGTRFTVHVPAAVRDGGGR